MQDPRGRGDAGGEGGSENKKPCPVYKQDKDLRSLLYHPFKHTIICSSSNGETGPSYSEFSEACSEVMFTLPATVVHFHHTALAVDLAIDCATVFVKAFLGYLCIEFTTMTADCQHFFFHIPVFRNMNPGKYACGAYFKYQKHACDAYFMRMAEKRQRTCPLPVIRTSKP